MIMPQTVFICIAIHGSFMDNIMHIYLDLLYVHQCNINLNQFITHVVCAGSSIVD